jgi:putative transposase
MAEKIHQIHTVNYGVYVVRKVHAELRRNGEHGARCPVERLMDREGLRGIRRAKGPRTTIPGPLVDRPADLVERRFTATAPDCLWVANITYIRTFPGWVYAVVIDVFARRVVGWQLSTSLHTDLALDALDMGIWTRRRASRDLSQLTHHSDSDHHLNAANIELFDTPTVSPTPRLSPRSGPRVTGTIMPSPRRSTRSSKPTWSATKDPGEASTTWKIATAEHTDWFNHRRLHGEIGYRPPIEVENEFLNRTTPPITTMDRV